MIIITCLSFSYTFAEVAPSVNTVIDTLYTTIDTHPHSLPGLLRDYCSAVLASPAFVKDGFVYNAQQSAFVHLLCRNMGNPSPYFAKETEYFKRTTFEELGFKDIITDNGDELDLCSARTMNNDCDLARNIPKLLNGILNDYVNIKQVSLYGKLATYTDDTELQKNVVNPYFSGYFGLDICDSKGRQYPKTCRMVTSYVKSVRNVLSEVSIFNSTGVLALVPTSNVVCGNTSNANLDVFYCGLKDDQTSMSSFVNLVYNEIFYYRLFMGYYMINLQKDPSLLAGNRYNNNYTTILKKFSSEYIRSKSALTLSLRMMRDTYVAFPFHVGFSMYQEDLDGFAKSLARIAPPIYTLYDKLRNVQKPK